MLANSDLADVDDIAIDPVAGQVYLRLDRAVIIQFDQARHRRQRVQIHALTNAGAQHAGVPQHERSTRY